MYLCKINGTTNPTSALEIDDRTITVDSNTGAVVGDCVNITEGGRYWQTIVTGIADCVITVASPCDYAFTTSASVCFGSWNLNVDGSTTSQEFVLCSPPDIDYDIYAISIAMLDKTAMEDSKFGGLTQLTNGIVGRIYDGYTKNLFLISNNAGFRENGFYTEYPEKVPTGDYAFWANKNYSQNNGVAIRIKGVDKDKISIIVQDDLTGLDKLAIVIHGHVVE